MNGFYVHASNIVNDESERYGPFPGPPLLTYEFLRCDMDSTSSGHVFSYADKRPGEEGWEHEVPPNVTFGWRRCYDEVGGGAFGIERGPYWTDLWFEFADFPPETTWASNIDPGAETVETVEARW